jgi:hypothetical protein
LATSGGREATIFRFFEVVAVTGSALFADVVGVAEVDEDALAEVGPGDGRVSLSFDFCGVDMPAAALAVAVIVAGVASRLRASALVDAAIKEWTERDDIDIDAASVVVSDAAAVVVSDSSSSLVIAITL